jgi:ABC-type multidrug transport system fused ATPase/permease subunit
MLSFLIYINWFLTIIIGIIFFLLTAIYLKSFREKLNNWGLSRQLSSKKRIQFMQEGFDGAKSIKLLGREDFFFHKFRKHNFDLSNILIKVGFFNNLPKLVFELLVIMTLVLVFFILSQNKINFAEIAQLLTVYVAASIRIMPSVNRIISGLQTMKYGNPSVNVLYTEFNNFKEKENQNNEDFSFKDNILVNVQKFKHNETSKFEIKNIQIKINKGDKIGIIGSSGSGKSSLVDIITGVFKPNDGDILVDGKSIFSNLRGWQNLIGYVPQKIFILDDSLRNNILFGLDNKKYNDSAIYQLIEKMNLNTLLGRLNNKLDSKLDEKGLNLSGGEIQRIGICRALVYEPQILFLDEATSSLDTFTEQQILNELNIFQKKTIISIAHRINTLKNCSKIYCIDNGKLADQGNFDKFKKQN